MPRARTIQTNFCSGILSGAMRGRVDLAQYGAAAEDLTNILVATQGGASRRPGSYYAGAVGNQAAAPRLERFTIADLTAYILEFNNFTLRFWRNRALLLDGTSAPLTLATPWPTAALPILRLQQSADVLYITHASYQPQKLSRTSATTFTLTPIVFLNGPYDSENTGNAPGAAATPVVTQPEAATSTPVVAPGGGGGQDGGAGGDSGAPGSGSEAGAGEAGGGEGGGGSGGGGSGGGDSGGGGGFG